MLEWRAPCPMAPKERFKYYKTYHSYTLAYSPLSFEVLLQVMGPVRLSIAFVAEWLKPVAFGPVSGFDFLCVFARLYLRRKIFKKKEVRLN